ncbi:hypothetical protein UFOVP1290_113 [uncultured Caudovirales phage]|uniref:Uncharacterized protein n=1 Tax=uncultured Caudovirales phage TaxID=2100421 RepID=A0A6J5RGX6_9CAUD|nr:hypothetical protein UFOVP1290_113 [uncultured Caudovirales phage]
MRTFTVKDFIFYNGPCFNCNSRVSIKLGTKKFLQTIDVAYLPITILNDYSEINLKISYKDILRLKIYNKTNRFECSSHKLFSKYLENSKIHLNSYCEKCYTNVSSKYLEFDLDRYFVKPIIINDETITVDSPDCNYRLYSSTDQNKSVLYLKKIDTTISYDIQMLDFFKELPLLPLYRFKNKEHFIKKIKTYLTFS